MCIDIGLQWVRVSLRGYGGELPTGTSFFDLLGVEPEVMSRTNPSVRAWQSANIALFAVDMSELQDFDEPTEEFAFRVEQGFLTAAEWLQTRPPAAFDVWRGEGRKADVFINGWLLNEQFDLMLPVPFLIACGQALLPIHVCTND